MVLPLANPDGFARGTRYNAPRRGPSTATAASTGTPTAGSRPAPSRVRAGDPRPARPHPVATARQRSSRSTGRSPNSTPTARSPPRFAQAMWDAMTPEQRAPYRLRRLRTRARPAPFAPPLQPVPRLARPVVRLRCRVSGGALPSIITLELPYDPSRRIVRRGCTTGISMKSEPCGVATRRATCARRAGRPRDAHRGVQVRPLTGGIARPALCFSPSFPKLCFGTHWRMKLRFSPAAPGRTIVTPHGLAARRAATRGPMNSASVPATRRVRAGRGCCAGSPI